MTVTRLGQLTADTQFTGDFITDGISAPDISSTKSNTGGFSYRFASNDPIGIGFTPAVSRLRAGVWVNHNGAPNSSSGEVILFRLRKGSGDATPHAVRWDRFNDLIELRIDNVAVETVAASSYLLPTVDTWMHLGIYFFADGTDGIFSFYLNGAQIMTFSGDTNADGIGAVLFGGRYAVGDAWSNFAYFDDFYVDSLTTEPDSAPSSKRFLYAIVDAAASTQFTPEGAATNVECVDDPGAPDDDTTYVKALTAGLVDTYEKAEVTVPGEYLIRAVIPIAQAKKTDSGTEAELKLGLFDGANTTEGTSQFVPTNYDSIWERFDQQPDGSPWNSVDTNAMVLRLASSGDF